MTTYSSYTNKRCIIYIYIYVGLLLLVRLASAYALTVAAAAAAANSRDANRKVRPCMLLTELRAKLRNRSSKRLIADYCMSAFEF